MTVTNRIRNHELDFWYGMLPTSLRPVLFEIMRIHSRRQGSRRQERAVGSIQGSTESENFFKKMILKNKKISKLDVLKYIYQSRYCRLTWYCNQNFWLTWHWIRIRKIGWRDVDTKSWFGKMISVRNHFSENRFYNEKNPEWV